MGRIVERRVKYQSLTSQELSPAARKQIWDVANGGESAAYRFFFAARLAGQRASQLRLPFSGPDEAANKGLEKWAKDDCLSFDLTFTQFLLGVATWIESKQTCVASNV